MRTYSALRLGFWLALHFSTCLLSSAQPQPNAHRQPPPVESNCGARLESGDIYLRCVFVDSGKADSKSLRLTATGGVTSWAISQDAKQLAIVRSKPSGAAVLELVDLTDGVIKYSRATDRRSRVDSSCGTIVLREYLSSKKGAPYDFYDVIANTEMTVTPSTLDLRCSADKRYTLRRMVGDGLYLDSLQGTRLIADGVQQFNISPDGHHIAYNQDDYLCARASTNAELGEARCVGMTWMAGPMAVSDTGEILFTEQTGTACSFKISGSKVSDPCPAIF